MSTLLLPQMFNKVYNKRLVEKITNAILPRTGSLRTLKSSMFGSFIMPDKHPPWCILL